MLIFSPEFTRHSHLAPTFIVDINDICQRDYGKSFFPSTVLCIDIDAYESFHCGNNDATMDAAIGIADYFDNHASNDRHLLVELRFGYRSTSNFNLSNMKRKVSHSRDVLRPERINEYVAFLYDKSVAPQANNYFSRLSNQHKELQKWKAMDVDGFISFIVDRATLPYEPENDLVAIVEDMRIKFLSGGVNELDILLKYWIEQMEKYNLRYKHAESNAIACVILSFLQSLVLPVGSFEEEYLAFRKEEIGKFVH